MKRFIPDHFDELIRWIGATHYYRDAATGIVFAYGGTEMCELRQRDTDGWRVTHSWTPRDGGVPAEATAV